MRAHTTHPVPAQAPDSHRLPSGWSNSTPINQRPIPKNITCDVLARLPHDRLTLEITMPPEAIALVAALLDFLEPDEDGDGG